MNENQKEAVPQDQNSGATQDQVEVRKDSATEAYKKDMLKYKDEVGSLREQLNSIELERQEKKGNFETVITKLKEELKAEKNKNAQLKVTYATKALDDSIKQQALSKGLNPQQVDVFMKLVEKDQKKLVEFDERFNANEEDIRNIIDTNMTRYSDIFKTKVSVADANPRSGHTTNEKRKQFDAKKASAAEIAAYLKKNF